MAVIFDEKMLQNYCMQKGKGILEKRLNRPGNRDKHKGNTVSKL